MHAAPLNAGYQTGLRPGASAGAEHGRDVQSEIEGLRLNLLGAGDVPQRPIGLWLECLFLSLSQQDRKNE
ncbi:MAG: hypothetical protein Q7W05_04360 [Deltaproteobacteria bacterium]|nr:hypothetical protein [Deltaproteobacteria bacterium]